MSIWRSVVNFKPFSHGGNLQINRCQQLLMNATLAIYEQTLNEWSHRKIALRDWLVFVGWCLFGVGLFILLLFIHLFIGGGGLRSVFCSVFVFVFVSLGFFCAGLVGLFWSFGFEDQKVVNVFHNGICVTVTIWYNGSTRGEFRIQSISFYLCRFLDVP